VVAPLPGAPGPETALVLWPQGLHAWKQGAQEVGGDLSGASVYRADGFDAPRQRQGMCKAGMIPNSQAHPRTRKRPKGGRKRCFSTAIHALRLCVERPLTWEDTCQRRWRRFERIQQRHYGRKGLAYTLIHLRASCGI
jgi:hypothetical protein